MSDIEVKVYDYQQRIFERTKDKRFVIIPKGRQTGLTYAGAYYLCKLCILNTNTYLWGDTIHSNIDRYVERYFLKFLHNIFGLNEKHYRWDKLKKCLYIGSSYIDFRSADNPMNWEGFNYHGIFLNEAGIILRDKYIYNNAVMPMMLHNPDSWVIAAGTPKGKTARGEESKFYALYKAALNDKSGKYYTETITTYQCPDLQRETIDELLTTIPNAVIKQEIYGEFVDSDSALLKYNYIEKISIEQLPLGCKIYIGVDLAISQKTSADYNAIAVMARDNDGKLYFLEFIRFKGTFTEIVETIVSVVRKHRPVRMFIETVQFQAAVFQEVQKAIMNSNLNVSIVDYRPDKDKITRFYALLVRYEAHYVFHVDNGLGMPEYENEVLSFPDGQHDDTVDAAVYAYMASEFTSSSMILF